MPRRTFSDKQLRQIDVVILCGGLGTRLRKIISNVPKPMAKVNDKPFLDILIRYISNFGFRRFILCTGYMSRAIEKYYRGKSASLEIIFSKEKKPLGTAGAVKNAAGFIKSNPFIVINGDSYCRVNIADFIKFHLRKKAIASIVVAQSDNVSSGGLIALNTSGEVIKFEEKVKAMEKAFMNAGIYAFERDILSMIPPNLKFSLEYDLFPRLVHRRSYGYITNAGILDIGTPECYEKAKEFFKC